MTRREYLKAIGVTAAGGAIFSRTAVAAEPFTLPALGYPFDALEPYIDAQTMQIHHDRHHAAYVNNLNKAIAQSPELGSKSIEELMASLSSVPETIRTAVRNNGGGHINHSLFWKVLKKSGGKPSGELAKALDSRFGGLSGFQEQFTKAALGVFGSGWAWLTLDRDRNLAIESTPNQDNPWMDRKTPLLVIDVWEHAYYLKYQNRRADYVAAWHNVVNWDFVSARYRELIS
ncbi:MAG: superoxide dismutase [Bryobacteraceae bacterium]